MRDLVLESNSENSLRFLLLYQRRWGMKFGQFYIDNLKKQYKKSEIGVITVKQEADNYFKNNNELSSISYYKYFDDIRDFSEEYLGDSEYSLEEILQFFGVDTVWPLLQATRNHIKDYKRKYNYSFYPALTDDELIKTIKAYYKLIVDIDKKFKPNFILLPNPVETFNILLQLYGERKGIPVRYVCLTPVKGFYQYVKTKDYGGGVIEEKFNKGDDCHEYHKKAENYIRKFRNEFIVPECAYHDSSDFLRYRIIDILKLMAKMLRAPLLKQKRPKGIHKDHVVFYPRLLLRDYILKIRYHNEVKRMEYDQMPSEKFVYFPLQMQPELAIDVLAPYFNNQIEAARLAAMSLPGEYTLVVKDHPIMVGLRDPKYLQKIQSLPNVKLVNYNIKTPEILSNCDAVIATTGSTVFETTLLGIPCVQLGNMQTSFMFENVHHVTDYTKLTQLWRKILGLQFGGTEYDKHIVRYISLVMKYGVETNYYEMWERDMEGDLFPMWNGLKRELDNSGY